MRALITVAFSNYLRLAGLRSLALAALTGATVGALALGVPAPDLAAEVFGGLLFVAAALLLLPVAAGLATDDRRGGYEWLQATRPLSSAAWGLGRVCGAVMGAIVLLLALELSARAVAGRRGVPERAQGSLVSLPSPRPANGGGREWRFAVPAGHAGALDLEVPVLMLYGGTSELIVAARRGELRGDVVKAVRPQRHVTVSLADLRAGRGDVFVTIDGGAGLLIAPDPPTLTVGTRPLAVFGLTRPALASLLLALLAVVAASCAFHFETACLAGLLAALARTPPEPLLVAVLVILVVVAMLGTALSRRAALP